MKENGILKNKIYLYMTEFFAGMSVMAVELGASRLLAPYFSSSQIVWTIIIGTIMIAMALGNLYGGRSADKDPDPGKLYKRMLLAAIWIAAIPVLGRYVILGVSGLLVLTIHRNFLILAAFLTCMILFVFPLALLGTVTPSLAKYCTNNLENNGRTIGNLNAFNTIGSILGTFLPTFVTIPAVGTSITFLIFSGVLLLLALLYFLSTGTKKVACIVSAVLFLLCAVFGNSHSFAFWENNLLYEGESVYNYLQVKDTAESIELSTNVLFGVQSVKMKEEGLTGMYYDYAMAAPLMAGRGEDSSLDILILGMGTGTYARQCKRYFDGVTVSGVEIDGKIVDLAEQYFDLPKDAKVTVFDGRAYLNSDPHQYDVIMVDAYQDITIPFQMSSQEFFTLVKDHLTEDGVMVVNMNMHSHGEGSINACLLKTIAQVFPDVCTVDVAYATNRELFASQGKKSTKERLEAALDLLEKESTGRKKDPKDLELVEFMTQIQTGLTAYEKDSVGESAMVLTDDKAPVEFLGMKMIDGLIQEELGYYKERFKEEGIRGILE